MILYLLKTNSILLFPGSDHPLITHIDGGLVNIIVLKYSPDHIRYLFLALNPHTGHVFALGELPDLKINDLFDTCHPSDLSHDLAVVS